MADNDEFDDVDEETPKDLRAQIKKLSKAVSDLTEQNEKLAGKDRTRTLSDHLSSKGLSPKVAGFVPAAVATDAASIDAWLAENGDVFKALEIEAPTGDAEGEVDDETKAAHERVAAATAGATSVDKLADINARLQAAETPEEVAEILASA